MLKLSHDSLKRLSVGADVSAFDCGDADLNDFLRNDSFKYLASLMAVTYLVEKSGRSDAFFSLSNDRLACDRATQKQREQWGVGLPPKAGGRSRTYYPAVKLGRLGISKSCQGCGLGSDILDFLKIWFVSGNKTGCRFIIVDAYNNPKVLRFYEKNQFTVMPGGKETDHTRLMFFDLKPFHDQYQTLLVAK